MVIAMNILGTLNSVLTRINSSSNFSRKLFWWHINLLGKWNRLLVLKVLITCEIHRKTILYFFAKVITLLIFVILPLVRRLLQFLLRIRELFLHSGIEIFQFFFVLISKLSNVYFEFDWFLTSVGS